MQKVDTVRVSAVRETFRQAVGRRALLLTAAFPFLVIGQIIDVVNDFLILGAEQTANRELEGRVFHLRIGSIEAFFVEDEQTPIPPLT